MSDIIKYCDHYKDKGTYKNSYDKLTLNLAVKLVIAHHHHNIPVVQDTVNEHGVFTSVHRVRKAACTLALYGI